MSTRLSNRASRMSDTPLTNSKHEHFAHLVVKGERPAKAYRPADKPEWIMQIGNRLLRKLDVAARVAELKSVASERQIEKISVDRAWVIAMLTGNVQRAMQPSRRAGSGPRDPTGVPDVLPF